MKKDRIAVGCLVLIGKDALAIPCLALVGAVSIMGATVYGSYKLTEKLCDVIADKVEECIKKNKTEG